PLDEDLPPGTLAFPHMVEASLLPRLRSFVALSELTGEGGRLSRRSFPASLHSPCDLLAKPGILGVCVPRTSTFQGQLFHHRFASAGSYAPTARRPPVRATGLRAFALRPFHPRASRRTLHRLSLLRCSAGEVDFGAAPGRPARPPQLPRRVYRRRGEGVTGAAFFLCGRPAALLPSSASGARV